MDYPSASTLQLHTFTSYLDPLVMPSADEQATAFKNEGNKAFAAHDFITAIDLYTKAIELNAEEPTYFSNRAQVHKLP